VRSPVAAPGEPDPHVLGRITRSRQISSLGQFERVVRASHQKLTEVRACFIARKRARCLRGNEGWYNRRI
jgi:hypothetical protein